uniref:Twin-arginine translocation signal domain-containing protein n=1 Tax=Schlesneria paludicola TaxID=360056 RepID=A0A7C2P2K3_9PLAN
MPPVSRRRFLQSSAAILAAAHAWPVGQLFAQQDRTLVSPGERPPRAEGVVVENPRLRVPVSLIIDDSTCLVNLAHYAIPQFAQVFPDNYRQPWKTLPREIPDAFVAKFAGWCHEHGVKGKYSIVPYPACVGWLDRDLPGWSKQELDASLQLVRDVILPDWDIHPEMVSHTFVIDTKTGRPYPEKTEWFMENWRWTDGKSVDQLTDYLSYALRILKNVGLPCEGVTTPGGFGNRVLPELSQANLQAVRDVYGAEIPHYFRHLFTDDRSVAPRVEYAAGLDTDHPKCSVSIIGCTGDWFGGWDGLVIGRVDQFITEDLKGGRLPQVIDKGEPAILVCHWPGIYCNGDETGFNIFQEVVARLHRAYDHLQWMKLSEIARYWAAKELTATKIIDGGVELRAPFAAPQFTVRVKNATAGRVAVRNPEAKSQPLQRVDSRPRLTSGTYLVDGRDVVACFDLAKGLTQLSGVG